MFDVEVSLTHDHQRTRQVHFYSFPEVIGLKPLHEIERTHCTRYYLANQLPEQESIFGEWMTAIQGFTTLAVNPIGRNRPSDLNGCITRMGC